ncbi:hypothetical protein HHI36_003732 [Cryptolaemus montrouzieri]|uniref:Nudix hydrolase domain-containing protein n=1 Tax=Cryptolaemus montrouzieri TaxID=559131 RepID=A0ABD2PF05_9CUCU
MEEFAKTMFMAIPSVCNEIENLPAFLREWRKYKLTIPTYGAIFISQDNSHVLMVQRYSGNWSFPRGKMESGENPEECAVREVFEENYLDHHVPKTPSLPSCRMEEFVKTMVMAIPSVCNEIENLPAFLREWRKYKLTIPTYGAIFISQDNSHVLMVQRYSGNWSFPRGKMKRRENPEECAVREVFEENYLDHQVAKTPSLPSCRMEEFAKTMIMAIPSVCNDIENLPAFLREWRKYKLTIPTYGAIFISQGKMESGENPEECAVREVFEEVGLDNSNLIKSDEYIENKREEKYSTLGIINVAWLFQIELAF